MTEKYHSKTKIEYMYSYARALQSIEMRWSGFVVCIAFPFAFVFFFFLSNPFAYVFLLRANLLLISVCFKIRFVAFSLFFNMTPNIDDTTAMFPFFMCLVILFFFGVYSPSRFYFVC